MQQYTDKLNFQIVLESEEVEESAPYWKKQCKMFYDSIRKNLPEGSVDPLRQKGKEGEKDVIITSFAVLKFAGITLGSFHVLLKLINVWERNRKKANIKLIAQNGSEFNLSNIPVDRALEIYKNINYVDNKQE